MTMWSCTVVQFNPKCQLLAENLLSQSNKQYIYDFWKKPNTENEEPFSIKNLI